MLHGVGGQCHASAALPSGMNWCAPQPVWTGAEYLAHTGIRSPDRLACSGSLYRLRYPRQPYSRLLQQITQIIVCTYHQSFPVINKLSTAEKTYGTTSVLSSTLDEYDLWESGPGHFIRREGHPRYAPHTRLDRLQGRLHALKKIKTLPQVS